MARDFDQARQEADSARAFWLLRACIAIDLVRTLAVQWVRTRLPIIAVASLLLSIALAEALAAIARRASIRMPVGIEHEDEVDRPVHGPDLGRPHRADDSAEPLGRPADAAAPTVAAVLQARGLTKRYGGLLALDRVSFDLRPGEIVGYLGPNGSGKSTTVNLVVGLLEPSAGDISLSGIRLSDDSIAYKRQIGYVPEEPSLYAHLTASDYLMLVGRLRRVPTAVLQKRVPELLRLLQLHDSRYKTMTAFSKGMRQRVLVSSALLHNPQLLVLDEPFSGLDVNAGLLLRTLLRTLADEGRMILFSTHRFDMVEKLCSRVIVLSSGRVVLERRVDDFAREGPDSLEETFVRATLQPDFAPLARQIIDTIEGA